jgi:hypothetical protein
MGPVLAKSAVVNSTGRGVAGVLAGFARARYLAAGQVCSQPRMIAFPVRSHTCHSHLAGLRLKIITSNMARTYRLQASRPCDRSRRRAFPRDK